MNYGALSHEDKQFPTRISESRIRYDTPYFYLQAWYMDISTESANGKKMRTTLLLWIPRAGVHPDYWFGTYVYVSCWMQNYWVSYLI